MTLLNKSTILAGLSHITAMLAGLLLLFFPVTSEFEQITDSGNFTQQFQTNKTIFEALGPQGLFVIILPWVLSGVCIFSSIMAKVASNDPKTLILRWKSYSWAVSVIFVVFILVSISSVGMFYIPSGFFAIASSFYNR
jgi:hypothetical protein